MDPNHQREVVLQTRGLSKKFGKRWAVKDLNLRVLRGDIFGFVGPNGAGKSTTIRMILTLLRPTTGSIEIFGEDLHENRRGVLSRVCGIVEKPDFYPYLSAFKNLEIFGSMTRRVKEDEILETLEVVGLKSRAFEKIKTFSHGMKQRLGIAQVLLTKPSLIILDEPTAGLDPQGMKEVRELIKKLSAEREMTIFLSSHLLFEVESVATRMAVINRGGLIAQGLVSDLIGAGATDFLIQVSPLDPAAKLIQELSWVEILSAQNGRIEVHMDSGRSSELNRLLVLNHIEVFSFYPRSPLEEYFLKITEGTSEI